MTRNNIQPHHILTALKENDSENVSTIETVYNEKKNIRMANKVGKTHMQALFDILETSEYKNESRNKPLSNQLEDLFFVNPTSMEIWRVFPHVLLASLFFRLLA